MNARLEISRQNHVLIILSLLLLISFGLRLSILDRDSLWFDEAFSYFIATHLPWQDILTNKIQSAHPPLYYLFLHYWLHLFPTSDGMGRLMSLFWGVAFAPTLYLLARQLLPNRRLALFAGAMATFSPVVAIYSAELRMYTQALFLTTVGTLAYVYAVKRGRTRFWGLFVIAFISALYTHLFAFFALVGIGLHGLIIRTHYPRSFWQLVGAMFVIVLFFAPWITVVLSDVDSGAGSLRPLTGDRFILPFDLLKPLWALTFTLFGASNSSGPGYPIPYLMVSFFLTFLAIIIVPLELRKSQRAGELDSWFWLSPLMIIVILGIPSLVYYIHPFFFPERTVIMALPFLLILVAWSATRYASPLPFMAYASVALMLFGTLTYLYVSPPRDVYHEVADFIVQQHRVGDVVLHTSDFSYLPVLRYTHSHNIGPHVRLTGNTLRAAVVYETINGQVWDYEQIDRSGDRMWLVTSQHSSWDWEGQSGAYFINAYEMVGYFSFGDVGVYLFDLKTGR